jgi:alkylation response protein AidB-like acyl-CoA dehydrogenase
MAENLEAFRAEAKEWLAANFPASQKNKDLAMQAEGGGEKLGGDAEKWRVAMADKGWGVPTWPKAYGGGGLSVAESRVLREEMGKIGARNPIGGIGVRMFAPTLLEYGTEEQKQRHIPPIARGEIRWCQGYSEPGAGSDLAALQTKCEDKGDHWLINGSKIWTSGAQYSDWCFCLVRTDFTKKHEGISFVLIDMRAKGVETRPIKMIGGGSPFCETFFENVKARKDDLVGPLNGGWTVGKRLLMFERQQQGSEEPEGPPPRSLDAIAKDYVGADAKGRVADPELRLRIVAHQMEGMALTFTARRIAAEAKGSNAPSPVVPIMKNAATSVAQGRNDLGIEIMGNRAFGWEGDGFSATEMNWVRGWLGAMAMSIYGGSAEVQNNIIAKRILGLPDPQGNVIRAHS